METRLINVNDLGRYTVVIAGHRYVPWTSLAEVPTAQQTTAKLDRSRLGGCEHCKGDLEGYTSCFRDVNGRSRRIYIPEGEANIVVPGMYQHKECIPIQFCPNCGRPLTEEAWAELERRINDETTDTH